MRTVQSVFVWTLVRMLALRASVQKAVARRQDMTAMGTNSSQLGWFAIAVIVLLLIFVFVKGPFSSWAHNVMNQLTSI